MCKIHFSTFIFCTKTTIFVQKNAETRQPRLQEKIQPEAENSSTVKTKARDDVEMQDVYWNQNQVIFKDKFVSNMRLGIKTMNKFLGSEDRCISPPCAAKMVLHLRNLPFSPSVLFSSPTVSSLSCGLGEPPPWTASRGSARWIPSHSGSSC